MNEPLIKDNLVQDGKRIAIADDHTMFRRGLGALIDLFPGYRMVLDAANGNDFIRQLNPDQLPDIVLLDIAMPEMDGYNLAAWITANHPEIKMLALSTMESETAIIRMIRAGARGYLLKDAEPAELKLAFDEVLSIGYYYNEHVSRQTIRSVNLLAGEPDAGNSLSKMSERERVFLQLACSEKTYYEISKEMFVSERTVDGYRDSLFRKLQVSTRVGLALYAVRNGLVHL
ncbi:response regulator [Flavitalea flava]